MCVGVTIKGKSPIHIVRTLRERKRNFDCQHFLPRGYFVLKVGGVVASIRDYIRIRKVDVRVGWMNICS